MSRRHAQERPRIAFFDYPDVFEDFYPHYGVDQRAFATTWGATGNHALVRLLQREVGDVVWYELCLAPELREAVHQVTGATVRLRRSSVVHRRLWWTFWMAPHAWRWRWAYPAYAVVASYVAPLSIDLLWSLWRDRPDAVFSQDYASGRFDVLLLIARALEVPLFAYHSGSRPERYVGRAAKRLTIRAADRVIVSSEQERRVLVERFGARPERVAVVLTPIDLEVFRPLDRRACEHAHGLEAGRRRVLFVGRLDDRVKRIGSLIKAFGAAVRGHDDVELVIAGTGRDEEPLRRLAEARAPGLVRFLGWVANGEPLARLLNTADCLALPSLSEGFPTVVGEAMACGTPVLGSRVGGIPELVVPGSTGWLVDPGDEDELCAALAAVLADPAATVTLRASARAAAQLRVAPEVIAAQLRELLPLPRPEECCAGG